MFSYFGSKSKIIHHYPPPRYNIIVEPFCGSTQYACRWGLERDVWINDKYQVIYRIWKYIQQATWNDIKSLPELSKGDDLRNFKQLSGAERLLLGFCAGLCRTSPGNVTTSWGDKTSIQGEGFRRNGSVLLLKRKLRLLIGSISHWKITCLDFRKIRIAGNATYYVDPPYQNARSNYAIKNSSPNFYKQLAGYCRSRAGQVIVCEADQADWLPFRRLRVSYSSSGGRTIIERIWTNG